MFCLILKKKLLPNSMALFDFLKNKKSAEQAKNGKNLVKKPAKVSVIKPEKEKVEKKVEKQESVAKTTPAKSERAVKFSYEAVKQPHISEKASYLAEQNQYIFKISPNYNKNEIKKAVEGIYNVDVLSVNIVKIPPKKRRVGKTEGFKKGYSKAIVRVKEGQKIEIL